MTKQLNEAFVVSAVRTPVGYRCKSCIDAQQEIFYAEFRPIYYVVAAVVALPLSLAAGWLIPSLGWYATILGALAGVGIAEITRWAIRRRRGKHMWIVVCGCIVVGSLPMVFLSLLGIAGSAFLSGEIGYAFGGVWSLLWHAVYVVTAVGAAYWRLRPGKRV